MFGFRRLITQKESSHPPRTASAVALDISTKLNAIIEEKFKDSNYTEMPTRILFPPMEYDGLSCMFLTDAGTTVMDHIRNWNLASVYLRHLGHWGKVTVAPSLGLETIEVGTPFIIYDATTFVPEDPRYWKAG